MTTRRRFLVALLVMGAALPGRTGLASGESWRRPVTNRNQFSPALLFIYLKPERANVLAKKEYAFVLDFDYSNIIVSQTQDEESLLLDLEYLSTDLRFEVGLGKGFQLGAALPLYIMYGGFLDPFISNFHKALGLPNVTRDRTPDNLFRYRYEVDKFVLLGRSEGTTAIGDFTLQIKKALIQKSTNEIAIRAAVKLPSGSRENLTGSGKADFGIGFAASRVGRRFGGYLNLSYHVLGQPESLNTKDYLSFMAGVDWRFKTNLAALIQYEQLERFLNSRLKALDQSGRQIILGLRWRRSDRFHFEWRFAEDLSSTSPDFSFGFQWAIRWAGGDEARSTR